MHWFTASLERRSTELSYAGIVPTTGIEPATFAWLISAAPRDQRVDAPKLCLASTTCLVSSGALAFPVATVLAPTRAFAASPCPCTALSRRGQATSDSTVVRVHVSPCCLGTSCPCLSHRAPTVTTA